MSKRLYLWGKRYSTARGNYWAIERSVTEETAQQWLAVYHGDEPQVIFRVSARKPAA